MVRMIELNQIYHEDCLEGMKRIPDKSVDMILCDLPYGTTKNKWDSIIPLEPLWSQYERVIKDNGAIVLTAQAPFDKILAVSNIDSFRYDWIWKKSKATGHLNAKHAPMKAHENVLVFYKQKPLFNHQNLQAKQIPNIRRGRNGNGSNYGKSDKDSFQFYTNYPKSILEFASESKTIHPTQKPVALFEYLIKTYTNESETVLDNCMGSGTTAIACMRTNRNFIGFELDERYHQIATERVQSERALFSRKE